MLDCIFCKIIQGDIPSRMVYSDLQMVVFHDIAPKAPVHVLLVPKKHIVSLNEAVDEDKGLLGDMMVKVKDIARLLHIDTDGYKIIANNGKGAGQLVFHLHFHILGGWKQSPGWEV